MLDPDDNNTTTPQASDPAEPAKAAKELVASGTATGTGAGEVTDQGVL